MMEEAQEEQQQDNNNEHEGIKCLQCDRRFTNAVGLRMHVIRKHTPGKGWNTGANFNKKKRGGQGQPWKPGQLEKFRKTMRKRARMRMLKTPIVYPLPSMQEEETATVRTPDHCPHCGENIRAWRYEP